MPQQQQTSPTISDAGRDSPPINDTSHEDRALTERPAPWYRREAWLAVCLAAFIPLVLGAAAPKGWQGPLFTISGAAFVASVVMLVRTNRNE
jgi:hypothetical protein